MISASVDMGPLLQTLEQLAQATSPELVAQAAEEDIAAFYQAHAVPVRTGRLKRSLTAPRSPDRRVVVLGDKITVQLKVPYAGAILRRLPPYQPQDLTARLGELVRDKLERGGP